MRTPALNRLGYIYDPETAAIVKVERGRGRKMPRKLAMAGLDRYLAKHPVIDNENGEPLPF